MVRNTVNWSNEEDEFLIQNYKTMIDRDIAMVLNRSEAAVKLHRLLMGLTKSKTSVKKKSYATRHDETPEERQAKANRQAAIDIIELLDDILCGRIIIDTSESNCELGEFYKVTIEYRNAPTEKYREFDGVSL